MNYNPEVLMKVLADKHEIPVETSMLLVAAIEKAVDIADDLHGEYGYLTIEGIIHQVFDEIYEG